MVPGMTWKPSKRQKLEYALLGDAMRQLEWDLRHPMFMAGRIPKEWRRIHRTPTGPKAKLTLRVDEDVVKFFRSLGRGYQEKMNLVLKGFMHARLSEFVEAPEWLDLLAEGEELDDLGVARPRLGDTEREMGEIRGAVGGGQSGE
jgi:uncharacterized protein (DUF4415 family)